MFQLAGPSRAGKAQLTPKVCVVADLRFVAQAIR